jgi:SlyX protein
MSKQLEELEIRLAFQERTIQELNDVVTRQQQDLARLMQDVERLRSQLEGLAPALVAPRSEETPPPHY